MKKYYNNELTAFENDMGKDQYWNNIIKNYCAELDGKININDLYMLKKDKNNKNRRIVNLYLKEKSKMLDPE